MAAPEAPEELSGCWISKRYFRWNFESPKASIRPTIQLSSDWTDKLPVRGGFRLLTPSGPAGADRSRAELESEPHLPPRNWTLQRIRPSSEQVVGGFHHRNTLEEEAGRRAVKAVVLQQPVEPNSASGRAVLVYF
jgi:hypothetical protein